MFNWAAVYVKVNGVPIGLAFVEDFFSKWGNCDGNNLVGLVAEAYLMRKLESKGYHTKLVFSHNIEMRRIEGEDFSYDCINDYGEVIKHMPEELKAIIEEFCGEGIDIKIENHGEVPVYFNEKMLFKTSFKKIYAYLSSFSEKIITKLIIFHPNFEPFLMALSYVFLIMLETYIEIFFFQKFQDKLEKILDEVDKV
ncbi:MAG: hypothetical protein QXI39_01030 [Candidatus Bathyarchaeia archaeon]